MSATRFLLRHNSAAAGWATLARRNGNCTAPALPSCSPSPSPSPYCISSTVGLRHMSEVAKSNGRRTYYVDTLALVRRLEAKGFPSNHAEAITSAITDVINDSLEMQKEHHFSLLQRETEKLRTDIEKMRSELRYEVDKVTAGLRLDLNLERGRIRDELAKQNAETTDLTTKLDREIHALRAHLEAAKYDVIKYCIGTLVSISAVGLAIIRILM